MICEFENDNMLRLVTGQTQGKARDCQGGPITVQAKVKFSFVLFS